MILNTKMIRKYALSPEWFKEIYIAHTKEEEADIDQLSSEMVTSIKKTSAYKDLNDNYTTGVTLKHKDLKEDIDYYKIEEGICTIVNIKSSDRINPRDWLLKSAKDGYFMEFALQGYILNKIHEEIKEFKYKHLVVNSQYPHDIIAYEFDPQVIRISLNALQGMLKLIKEDKDYKNHDIKWEKAIRLPQGFLYNKEKKELEEMQIKEQEKKNKKK